MIKNILLAPGSGDEGLAIGAAYTCFFKHCNKKEKNTLVSKNPYLGNSHTDYEIEKIINKTNLRKNFIVKKITKKGIAKLLANEEIVGIFSGKMEFGPRALGNRSILADPRSNKMQKNLNLKVKYRESFRPFAPSVLREDLSHWFNINVDSPYMLLVASINSEKRIKMTDEQKNLFGIQKLNIKRSEIPAVTHVELFDPPGLRPRAPHQSRGLRRWH